MDADSKWCTKGEHAAPKTQFYKHAKHPDGLSSSCKECTQKYMRDRRAQGLVEYDPERHKKYLGRYTLTPEQKQRKSTTDAEGQRKRRLKKHRALLDHLLKHPCVDCGESDPLVLDIDHVRGEKVLGVSDMIARGMPWGVIASEMEKCESRCRNCHARRTAMVGGHSRFLLLAEMAEAS